MAYLPTASVALIFAFAIALVLFEQANHPILAKARKFLDKCHWTAKPRAMARAIVLIAVLVQVSSFWIAALTGIVVLFSHTISAYLQVLVDRMFAARPQRPGANLKTAKSYDKVWGSLKAARRRKSRVLNAADVGLAIPLAIPSVLVGLDLIDSAYIELGQLLLLGLACVALVFVLWRIRRRSNSFHRDRVPARVEKKLLKELNAYQPEIVVYFSGNVVDRYQLDQWIGPINALKRRVMIVVREEAHLGKFPKTMYPVVAARTVRHLDATIVPSLKLALYVSNAALNMHLLRNGSLAHAYLNHGDSDKVSSANPFSRAYNTLFVAGQAGLDRYLRVGFDGVKPSIEMIGRPQLQGLAKSSRKTAMPGDRPTILYAPTWEGVVNSADYSSITSLGIGLAKAATEARQANLVIRPHPNTGRFSQEHKATLAKLHKIASESEWVQIDEEKELLVSLGRADVLVSDVSAVVSDYLTTGRPIIMTRPSHRSDADFTKEFPLAGATTLVPSDNPDQAFAIANQSLSNDSKRKTRATFTEHVLGYHPKGPQQAFAQAITSLLAPTAVTTKAPKAKRPRSILITLNALDIGGAEHDVLELSAALIERGHSVTVLARDGEIRSSLDDRVRFVERPTNVAAEARCLLKAAAKADVINTHDLRSLALLGVQRQRPPIHATVHNVESSRNDRAARWLLQNVADTASFVSETERSRLFPHSEFGAVIRHGLIPRLPERLSSAGKPKKNLVVFVGRLSFEKGADHLIKALVHLPDHHLRLVGDGPERPALEQLASQIGISQRVEFTGSTGDPFAELSKAGVVAIPSRQESLPRIVREAASLGRPVVASPLDGIIEAADSYRRIAYADPADDVAFAKALATTSDGVDRRTRQANVASGWDSGWQLLISAIEQLCEDGSDQGAANDAKQKNAAKYLAASYPIDEQRNQRKNRYLNRVNQIAKNERRPSENAARPHRWQQKRKASDHAGTNTNEDRRTKPAITSTVENPVQPAERQNTHNARFDNEVRQLVEPSTEIRLASSPASNFPVCAITQEIQLPKEYGEQTAPDAHKSEHRSGAQTGNDHQRSDCVVVNGQRADLPGQTSRDASTIEPAGPVLTTLLSRQDEGSVVAERCHEATGPSVTMVLARPKQPVGEEIE